MDTVSVFFGLILLPWIGGLILTGLNFWYMSQINGGLRERVNELHLQNEELRQIRDKLVEEKHNMSLTLQATMVENAMLSVKREQLSSEPPDSFAG